MLVTLYASVDGRVCVRNEIVEGPSPCGCRCRVERAGDCDRASGGSFAHHAFGIRERDSAQGCVELRVRIAANVLHRALGRDFSAKKTGAEVVQCGVSVGERIVGGDVRNLCAKRGCFSGEFAAGEIAIHDEALQKRASGNRLILRIARDRNEPAEDGWIVQNPGQLLSIDCCVVLSLHDGRTVIIDRCIENEMRVAGLDGGRREMERCRRGIKFNVKSMRGRLVAGVVEASVRIGERSGVFLQKAVEGGIELDIAEIERERAGSIVVENRPVCEHRMANAEIEYGRVLLLLLLLNVGRLETPFLSTKICATGLSTRMFVEVPFAPKDRDDANACLGVLHLEQWRRAMRACAIDGEAVEINAERSEMEVEVLKMYRDAKTLSGFLLDEVDEICVSARTVHQQREN